MPEVSDRAVPKRRNSTPHLTCFPSLTKWEDPWEAKLDLKGLRARAAYFADIRKLVDQKEGEAAELVGQVDNEDKVPRMEPLQISTLVEQLSLPRRKERRLKEDAGLIAEWYLLPERLARENMGHLRFLDQLEKAAMQGAQLYNLLAPIAGEAEHLFQSMPSESGVMGDVDLFEPSHSAGTFAHHARGAGPRSGSARLTEPLHK